MARTDTDVHHDDIEYPTQVRRDSQNSPIIQSRRIYEFSLDSGSKRGKGDRAESGRPNGSSLQQPNDETSSEWNRFYLWVSDV